jgi:uncharacterized protein YndB with AHSA1/START domain
LKVTPLNDLEVALTRDFHAPRQLVFDALTKPELIRQWLGIHGSWQWVVCDVDLRVGGTYRYLWRNAKGKEMGMGGRFVEIVAPERLVNTELFDDPWYEGEGLATAVLTERDGWTTLTTTMRAQSKQAMETVLRSGMTTGVTAAYDKMDDLLAVLTSSGATR